MNPLNEYFEHRIPAYNSKILWEINVRIERAIGLLEMLEVVCRQSDSEQNEIDYFFRAVESIKLEVKDARSMLEYHMDYGIHTVNDQNPSNTSGSLPV